MCSACVLADLDLPPIEATGLLSYLVLDTSYYTAQQFKTFKSLEAYNQMVSGFITSVQGKVAGKYVAKVRHSQRMNDPPIPVWVISSQEGTTVRPIAWVVRLA